MTQTNAPLNASAGWDTPPAERQPARPLEILAALGSVISTAGIVGGFVLWMTGALAGTTITSQQLVQIGGQVHDLGAKIEILQQQLNNGPRLDQLHEMDRHLSALDGRMDGMDTRMRDAESRLTRALTLLDGIDIASRAQLQQPRR